MAASKGVFLVDMLNEPMSTNSTDSIVQPGFIYGSIKASQQSSQVVKLQFSTVDTAEFKILVYI